MPRGHCLDYWHKWKREYNFCGLRPQDTKENDRYLALVERNANTSRGHASRQPRPIPTATPARLETIFQRKDQATIFRELVELSDVITAYKEVRAS